MCRAQGSAAFTGRGYFSEFSPMDKSQSGNSVDGALAWRAPGREKSSNNAEEKSEAVCKSRKIERSQHVLSTTLEKQYPCLAHPRN